MKVTAVLLNYKRPNELELVKKSLEQHSFIDEILVHDNSVGENIINYGRYVTALKAKNEIIYTQDDDCIISNAPSLYKDFDGTRLVNGLAAYRVLSYREESSMMGWGAFFDREWIGVLKKYTDRFGEDYIFYRETDRIFTSLLEVPRLTKVANVINFPSCVAPFALCMQPEHEETKKIALERCKVLRK